MDTGADRNPPGTGAYEGHEATAGLYARRMSLVLRIRLELVPTDPTPLALRDPAAAEQRERRKP